MSEFKYVMFRDKHGREFPVIFPGTMVHKDTAEAVMHAYRMTELGDRKTDWDCPKPISAGTCQVVALSASGSSETLGIESRDKDRQIMNTHNYTGGVESGMEPLIEKMILAQTCRLMLDMVEGDGD